MFAYRQRRTREILGDGVTEVPVEGRS